ncbi:MAG: nickel pincer cofactor biosynthesis protein LarC [Planctomycetes bacterium]|nr:nickel pincer cofactor biosynthesis protein LarC [Planctomycetota bacterium]MCP4771700.1 nickel pincer cofactor biosynthesis protein LarC [Planctomycetota bacterium]MCP4860000.1 nickel pincer cofactor biosynthesis protein LarC [Planctomycetota bacterium]
MRVFLNLFGGVAGDMLVAGLLDAGANADLVDPLLACLPAGEVQVRINREKRHGIAGNRFLVEAQEGCSHRHLSDVMHILEQMPLTEQAAQWATSAFHVLATAEARAHDCTIEEVHFHEVGAIDAIVDIAVACALMDSLQPSAIFASAVTVGSGVVQCAHGHMPVPAPATLFLLEGMPTCGFELQGECATPTGVALLKAWQVKFGNRGAAVCRQSGFGLGTRDPEDRANLLRVELEEAANANEWLVELRCLIDDQSGEIIGDAMEQLRTDGALEVYANAATTKKGRPAFEVVLLCDVPRQQFFEERLFRLLGTLGLRVTPLQRTTLPRDVEHREDEHGRLSWKTRELPSGQSAAKPEFEALRQRAAELGLSPRELLERLQSN